MCILHRSRAPARSANRFLAFVQILNHREQNVRPLRAPPETRDPSSADSDDEPGIRHPHRPRPATIRSHDGKESAAGTGQGHGTGMGPRLTRGRAHEEIRPLHRRRPSPMRPKRNPIAYAHHGRRGRASRFRERVNGKWTAERPMWRARARAWPSSGLPLRRRGGSDNFAPTTAQPRATTVDDRHRAKGRVSKRAPGSFAGEAPGVPGVSMKRRVSLHRTRFPSAIPCVRRDVFGEQCDQVFQGQTDQHHPNPNDLQIGTTWGAHDTPDTGTSRDIRKILGRWFLRLDDPHKLQTYE